MGWGWTLILLATGVWIVQFLFVAMYAINCGGCNAGGCNVGGCNVSDGDVSDGYCWTFLDFNPYGMGTAAAFTSALGVLLSIPAVLRSEQAILDKQQRKLVRSGEGLASVVHRIPQLSTSAV
jgi:hypothetical protein